MPKVQDEGGSVDEAEQWSADVATTMGVMALWALDAALVCEVAVHAATDVDSREAGDEASRRVRALASAAYNTASVCVMQGTPGKVQRGGLQQVAALGAEAWSRARAIAPRLAARHPLGAEGTAVDAAGFVAELAGHSARAAGSLTPATEAAIVRDAKHWTARAHRFAKEQEVQPAAPSDRDPTKDLAALARVCMRSPQLADAAPIIVFAEAVRALGFSQSAYDRAREDNTLPWHAVAAAQYLKGIGDGDGSRDIARAAVQALGYRTEVVTGAARSHKYRVGQKAANAAKGQKSGGDERAKGSRQPPKGSRK